MKFLVDLCGLLIDEEIVNFEVSEEECSLYFFFVCIVEEVGWFVKEFVFFNEGGEKEILGCLLSNL